MASIFDVSDKTFKHLEEIFKQSPKDFKKVSASVVTNMAFGTRKTAIKTIHNQMTVRSSAFVNRAFKVSRASLSAPIDAQSATLETRPDVVKSGWTEQEFGKRQSRSGTVGKGARQGWNKQIPKRFRNKGRVYRTSDFRFKAKTKQGRTKGLISYMYRRHKGKQFMIEQKTYNLEPGRVVFYKNRLQRLSYFKAKHQPRTKPWLNPSAQRYQNSQSLERLWDKALIHHMSKWKVQ